MTERIPLNLHGVSRLNRDESNIVLYNALRGFNDTSKLVVPAQITDKMIGFTPNGQTKVWVNENFGMNYPVHYDADLDLNEAEVVHNLVNAVSTKSEFAPDYANALRSSGNFNNALNFIRTNSGVPTNVLESNRIDISRHLGRQNVGILNNENHIVVSQPIYDDHARNTNTGLVHQSSNFGYNNPTQINSNANFSHAPIGTTSTFGGQSTYQQPGGYQIPSRYNEASNANRNTAPKFLFTHN